LYDVSIVGNTRVRSYKVSTIVQIDKIWNYIVRTSDVK